MSDKAMADKLILPQNTRLMGVFLGFIGGSLDVFCHIQYHSLVATTDWEHSPTDIRLARLECPQYHVAILLHYFLFPRISVCITHERISQNSLLAG